MASDSSNMLDIELLSAIVETVSDGVVLCEKGQIVWANSALLEVLRQDSMEAVLGQPFAGCFEDIGQGLPGDNGEEAIECQVHGCEQEPCTVLIKSLDLQGKEAWLVQDVTFKHSLQEEVRQIRAESDERQREGQQMRRRLRQDAEQREELLMVVSHELRTPVTVITGYNRLLLQEKVGPLNEEQSRFVSEITKSCQRLSHFIGNLLEASRDAFGELALDLREGSIAPIGHAVVSFLRPLLEEHDLEATCLLAPENSHACFDPVRVEQVLTNLIGNAIKYIQRGGAIEVAASPIEIDGQRWLEVAVSDNGPGIQEEDRERIFEPYTRAGDGLQAGGLGLGLSICKRIVESHGGTIRVEDSAAGGSRFVFTLPGERELVRGVGPR